MIHIFPVRHHSPASSLLAAEFIAQIQPQVVLIEGPADANHLIDILTDAETAPPVAILAYQIPATSEAPPQYLMYPFASYSPEYMALKTAQRLGIPARFVDIPAGVAIQLYQGVAQMTDYEPLFDALIKQSGYRSFEEFWETTFESGGLDVAGFVCAMLDYARLLRHVAAASTPAALIKDQLREQAMFAAVKQCLADGIPPDKIVLLCGAFHAAAFVDPPTNALPADAVLPPAMPIELTVIPYSYPRLSEQSGYGAGNRAPLFYEKVFQHQGDFAQASLETMVALMNYLHFKGHSVSLADVIEANRLARVLAGMREKRAPGLEEIREALIACLAHGSDALIDQFLGDFLIGQAIGKVSAKIGKTALQQEFYREVNLRKIPLTDCAQEFILHLTNAVEIGSSIFLHRLRLSQIPLAQNQTTVSSAYDYLAQLKEKWQVQWTPAVDATLVEKSLAGNSLLEVCRRVLRDKLHTAQNAREAAEVLLEIAVCDVNDLIREALLTCDQLAAADSDFFSLARACQNLQALLAYGSSRHLAPDEIAPMLTRTFNRAVLLIPTAVNVSDDAVEQVCLGLTILHDLSSRSNLVNQPIFAEMIHAVLPSYAAHPKIAGLAAAIAYLGKMLPEDALVLNLSQRLSVGNEPFNAAHFLDGFLSLNKIVLVRNLPVVKALDAFVQGIRAKDFVTVLPVLRRAFADVSRGELTYFLEHLAGIHQLAQTQTVQQAIETPPETLQHLDDVAQALDDLF